MSMWQTGYPHSSLAFSLPVLEREKLKDKQEHTYLNFYLQVNITANPFA